MFKRPPALSEALSSSNSRLLMLSIISIILPLLLRILADAEEVLQVFATTGAHFVEEAVAAAAAVNHIDRPLDMCIRTQSLSYPPHTK